MPRLLLAWLGIAVALLDRLLKVALECHVSLQILNV